MTADALRRVRAWLTDTFTYDSQGEAADAMADATRWGWLPALSGVAMGAEQARAVHAETRHRGTRIHA
ncbi:hypothetical protein FDW83_18615 [Pseudarthrobacter sp. NamE2]|uniref:hypothetical protein n=1 Tax=Pseudarthrobacter sp. NamE2 TaxID=2576838 RepID=UPI0010FCE733|nr:hypothetical protein [Pseudarthrobacter sp. NamE2]TLM80666.1 hypothetical protein FDW83_18615 [Pseudarthrobacter sp. NamE2]